MRPRIIEFHKIGDLIAFQEGLPSYIKTVQIEQTGNVASVQNVCAKTTLSRQFK